MGPASVLSAPGWPHVCPVHLAIRDFIFTGMVQYNGDQYLFQYTWSLFNWISATFINSVLDNGLAPNNKWSIVLINDVPSLHCRFTENGMQRV